ncbi:MAG: Maf family nucleotide pyrophosphatase [Betaproteobacteria bacterium]|nr:Maf family nucleotide pyrophosphatase [Betaproteobacteria bacterium]
MSTTVPALVLASTSRYRRELLERLGLPFGVDAPSVDESVSAGESPQAAALRLSALKAQAVAPRHPHALIIGSDQIAELNGRHIGKPGHHAAAVAQLQAMRGQTLRFHTGLSLLNTASGTIHSETVTTEVRIRTLSDNQIEHYLQRERPYDCAGSAKSEALGIALMESLRGDDPTALIGLPLIALTRMLASEGVDVLLG